MRETRTPTKVLVPVDDATDRLAAIETARHVAKRLGVPIEVIRVVAPNADISSESSAAFGRLDPEITVTTVRSDSVVDSITLRAAEPGVLLCVPTWARMAVVETVAGSHGAALLQQATTPLVVIGPDCAATMRGSILAIAVDGTHDGERIVGPAVALAEALRLTPMLYQVLPPSPQHPVADSVESSYVARLAGQSSRPALAVQYEVLHDDHPSHALARLTQDEQIAVLAMSSHGAAPNERLLLPSVAHGVIRHAKCPVLLGPRHTPVVAHDHGTQRRVVVGVDGSPADQPAVRVAVEQAELHGAALEIVHAWAQSWYFVDGGAAVYGDFELDRRAAREILDGAVTYARTISSSLTISAWLPERLPLDALLEAAIGAQLVVVGEHRYNLLERLVLGSTTQALLHRSPVPVMVVPEWVEHTSAETAATQ